MDTHKKLLRAGEYTQYDVGAHDLFHVFDDDMSTNEPKVK